MLSQVYVEAIQRTFNKEYTSNMLKELKKMGHNDANPVNIKVHLGLLTEDFGLKNVYLTVQTKQPEKVLAEYHVWLRPLSKEIFIGTNTGWVHIDEAYSTVNGSSAYLPTSYIDDTQTWN